MAAAGVFAVGAAAWPYAVDDAYVLARYARRLVTGMGYTFVDGPPTDGVTGPLGLLPGLVSQLVTGDALLGAKLVGLVCAAASAAWVTWRAGREAGSRGIVTALLLLLWPLLGIWSVAGLETGLATLACTAVALSLVDGSPWRLGSAVACLAWLRPEAAPACLVALAWVTHGRGRRSVPAWALAGLGAAGIVAFRLALFDSPLPLSAAAKPPDLVNGLGYAGRAGLGLLGGLGVVPLGLAVRTSGPRRGIGLVLLVHLAAVVLAGGDWMPGFRLFVPWLPAMAFVMAAPIVQARRSAAVGLFVGATLIPAGVGTLALVQARAAGHARETSGAELSSWLSRNAERVALVDVGYLAYAGDFDVVDLGGITDPSIGRLRGGHAAKQIDPGLLLERSPDTIVLHSSTRPLVDDRGRLLRFAGHPVERRVAAMPWVRARMRVVRVQPYAPGVWYVVLQPSADAP